MRQATAEEYAAVYNRHGYMDVSRCSRKRYFTATSKDRGTEVCSKTEILKRGKVVSTTFLVNPDYLPRAS